MISLNVDVVKVNAHTHMVGIAAEHAWINFKYPNSVMMEQSLTTLELLTGKDDYKSGQVHFDIMKIRLADGREKEIYFDISSFFDGVVSSQLDKREFMAQKLLKIYGD